MIRNTWKFYVMLSAVMLFFAVFLIYPLMDLIRGSMWIEVNGEESFSLIFFKIFFQSSLMWNCFGNSLMLALISTVGCLILSLPLAGLFSRYQFRFKSVWHTLLMSPLILPPFVGAIGLQQLLGRFGALNHLLGLVGDGVANPRPVDWLGIGGFWGIVLMQILHLFPIMFLNILAAWGRIGPSVREAGLCLGGSRSHVFRTVSLPLMLPGIFSGAVLVFVWAFTDLGTPLIFGYYNVVAVQIFDRVNEAGFNPYGYAMVMVVLLVTVGLFLFSRRLLARHDFASQVKGEHSEECLPLKGIFFWLATAGVAAVSLASLLPHFTVMILSISGKWFMSPLPEHWTLSHYLEVAVMDQTRWGLGNSFLYSTCSAAVDVVLGCAIAYWLVRRTFPGQSVLDALTVLPLALPGIVLAFGYVMAFRIPGSWHGYNLMWLKEIMDPRENPTVLLIISYSVRRLPYIVRAIYAGLQQVHPSLEEASRNLGAGTWTTWRRVLFPLLKGNIVAGAVLTFAFAFLEVSDSLILAMKERFYPVTKTIYILLGRIEPGSAGVACALGVLGMLLLFSAFYFASRLLGKRMGSLFG